MMTIQYKCKTTVYSLNNYIHINYKTIANTTTPKERQSFLSVLPQRDVAGDRGRT